MLKQIATFTALTEMHSTQAHNAGNAREAKAWADAAKRLLEAAVFIRMAGPMRLEDEYERNHAEPSSAS